MTVTVSTNAGLSAAYSAAVSGVGDHDIQLAPGSVYGAFVFNGGSAGAAAVSVKTAAGAGGPAVFQGVTIKNTSQGLTLSGVDFNNVGFPGGGGGVNSAFVAPFGARTMRRRPGRAVSPISGPSP